MRRRTSALFIILTLACPAWAADGKLQGNMEPLPHELLEQPIILNNHCNGVSVVEWKGTTGRKETTTPSTKAEKIINETCNLALSNLDKFVKERGLIPKNATFKAKVSLLPADIHFEGKDYRNLNDKRYRFKYRARQDVRYIWGYASESGHLYVRNDVLKSKKEVNEDFKLIFAHELWHMFSFQYGIFDQLPGDESEQYIADEVLAHEFTHYIGLGY